MKKSIIIIFVVLYSCLGANMLFANIDITTPNPFTFTDRTNVALSTEYKSNAITVAGINTASPISVAGGTYSINGGTYTSVSGYVSLGNTVKVRKVSAATYSTTKSATLTIGGVSDTFSVTTHSATTPDPFTFTDRTNVALSTEYKSNAITVSGLGAAAPISITGGTYAINGGTYTSASSTVNNGNTVKVRKVSASTYSTTKSATLTIGGVSDTFSVTTLAAPTPPSVPAGLAATFGSGNITLNWTASSGGGLTGYNVYRSADYGITYTKINASLVTGVTYQDTTPLDGMYYYQVTAVGSTESARSNIAKNAIGTRLDASYGSSLNLSSGGPYVADGSTTIEGDLVINAGVKLFVLDGATIDILEEHTIQVYGLLRVEASNSHHATFTSHKTGFPGTAPDDTYGFILAFNATAVSYNAATNAGCIIQNTTLSYMRGHNDAIDIYATAPKIYNCKITANASGGWGYVWLLPGCGAVIEHCSFTKALLIIDGSMASWFKADYNIFRSGYYAINFNNTDPTLISGQIINNDIDYNDTGRYIYIYGITGSGTIPLDNNYWHYSGSTNPVPEPVIHPFSTDWTATLTPVLSVPPTGVGPDW